MTKRTMIEAAGRVSAPVLAATMGLAGFAGYAAKDLKGGKRCALKTASILGSAAASAALLCHPALRVDIFGHEEQTEQRATDQAPGGGDANQPDEFPLNDAAGPALSRTDLAELAVSGGIWLAERALDRALRRSSLHRPGTVTGAVVGLERVLCTHQMVRRWEAKR